MSRLVISLITITRLLWAEIFFFHEVKGKRNEREELIMESLSAQIPEGVKRLNIIKKLRVTKT